jgi:hypothetical protein
LKNTITESPAKRSSVPCSASTSLPSAAWNARSRLHHLLGLGGLGEGGEAAQVEELDRDLAAMGLQHSSPLPGGDRLGELRREEALQARQALVLQALDAQERLHAREELRLVDGLRRGSRRRPPRCP